MIVTKFLFQGIWMKHVQYYLDRANDSGRVAKYAPFLHAQYSKSNSHLITHFNMLNYFLVHNNAVNSENNVGFIWWTPASVSGISHLERNDEIDMISIGALCLWSDEFHQRSCRLSGSR